MSRQTLLARLESQEPPAKKPAREDRFSERHYRVSELATMWNLSRDKILVLFRNVPGVVRMGTVEGTPGKRRYATLLIPASVARRVYDAMSTPT